ncbi:hypothetical protein J4474_02570 [Candidatus Pacearchaeota archaeon]|nr:hypothetical protein [Candidatus Pacearchaeota archaeon]
MTLKYKLFGIAGNIEELIESVKKEGGDSVEVDMYTRYEDRDYIHGPTYGGKVTIAKPRDNRTPFKKNISVVVAEWSIRLSDKRSSVAKVNKYLMDWKNLAIERAKENSLRVIDILDLPY